MTPTRDVDLDTIGERNEKGHGPWRESWQQVGEIEQAFIDRHDLLTLLAEKDQAIMRLARDCGDQRLRAAAQAVVEKRTKMEAMGQVWYTVPAEVADALAAALEDRDE